MIKQQIAKLLGLDDAYKRLIQIELKQEQCILSSRFNWKITPIINLVRIRREQNDLWAWDMLKNCDSFRKNSADPNKENLYRLDFVILAAIA